MKRTSLSEFSPIITETTEKELFLLSVLAYNGSNIYHRNSEINKIHKNLYQLRPELNYTAKETEEIVNEFLKTGILEQTYYSIRVSPELAMETALYTYSAHGTWPELFRTKCTSVQTPEARALWKIAGHLAEEPHIQIPAELSRELVSGFMSISDLHFLVRTLRPYVLVPEFTPLIIRIPEYVRETLILLTLNDCSYDDYFPEGTFGRLRMLIGQGSTPKWTGEREGIIGLYEYIATGDMPVKPKSPQKGWGARCTNAISALYRKDTAEASEEFEKGLNIISRTRTYEYIHIHPMIILMMAYTFICTDNEKGLQKLDTFLQRPNAAAPAIRKMTSLLTTSAFRPDFVPTIGKRLIQDISSGYSPTILYLFAIIYRYLGLDNKTSAKEAAQAEELISRLAGGEGPHQKLLLHEFSACCTKTPRQTETEDMFGGESLFAAGFSGKELWELSIGSILRALPEKEAGMTDSTATGKEPQERYSYHISSRYLEIRLQGKLKSGRWGAGKRISYQKFLSADESIMDGTDIAVKNYIANNNLRDIYFEDIAHLLVGCDRVFYGIYAPFEKVHIKEEKPYVELERLPKDKGFRLTTNLGSIPTPKSINVIEDISYCYRVVRLSPVQIRLMTQLTDLKQFPPQAEARLKDMLNRLDEFIEVRSELTDTGYVNAEGWQGTTVRLRQTADKTMFTAEFVVKPLAGCDEAFVPGEGNATVRISHDGQRYKVHRNLSAERTLCNSLTGHLAPGQCTFSPERGYTALTDAETVLCLLEYIADNSVYYSVEWPEGVKLNLRGKLTPKDWDIQAVSAGGWFELAGEIHISEEKTMSAYEFLARASSSSSRFIRLGEDEYIALADSIRKELDRLMSISSADRESIKVSKFNAEALSSLVGKDSLNISCDKGFSRQLALIRASYSLEPQVPEGLEATLRQYQTEGFRWLVRLDSWGAGACLADDMGLGKTLQAIAFLLYKAYSGASLVLAPASVITNWQNEIARFAPSLRTRLANTIDDRASAIAQAGPYDIILSSYGLVSSAPDLFCGRKWNVVCLDEAHAVKNRDTKISSAVQSLQAASRLILTGTPVQNHVGELWNLFQFINPGLLGPYETFRDRYLHGTGSGNDTGRLKDIISPFILRRRKCEVLDELPDKTDINITVTMSEDETAVYEAYRSTAENRLNTDNTVSAGILSDITRLRQLACSPALVSREWGKTSSKTETLLSLIYELLENDARILIFSQFTSYLDIIADALDRQETDYLMLTGSTPLKERSKMVRRFQSASAPSVFLISLKAGGLGLNLTAANCVIHTDPWWNPAIEEQATDRAYRIGQKQNVTVYHLISENTIEEKILDLHKSKRDMAGRLLEGTDISSRLTFEEVARLLGK